MKAILIPFLALLLLAPLGGCATREETGTVIGGILGGVAGSQVGKGKGRTAATIAGTLAGAMIGGAIGRYMDEADRRRTQEALEYNRSNEPASWRNPDTGYEYTVTPARTYQADSGMNCREYSTEVVIDGRRETAYGTACRQPDGTWRVQP